MTTKSLAKARPFVVMIRPWADPARMIVVVREKNPLFQTQVSQIGRRFWDRNRLWVLTEEIRLPRPDERAWLARLY